MQQVKVNPFADCSMALDIPTDLVVMKEVVCLSMRSLEVLADTIKNSSVLLVEEVGSDIMVEPTQNLVLDWANLEALAMDEH